MKAKDFTNQKINMLTAIKKIESKNNRTYWLCKCDCGKEIEVMTQDLIYKTKYSCGCVRKKKKNNYHKYDFKVKRLYNIWCEMKHRCYRKENNDYKYYGEKGIKLCEEWKNNFLEFQNWSLNNGYQDNLTIDRINSNDNYCPNNCRWITLKENSLNRKGIIKINYNGKNMCLKDFCKEKNISYNTAIKKYKKGINIL